MSDKQQQRADGTREKILAAARQLFVEKGFAATSMGQVAKLAEINHSLIFHHFTNKAGLWKAVQEEIVNDVSSQAIVPSLDLPFDQFVLQILTNSVNFFKQNPDMVAMVHWRRIEKQQDIAIGAAKNRDDIVEAIKAYQDKGAIKSDAKPEYMATFMMSISMTASLDPIVFVAQEKDLTAYLAFSAQSIVKAFSA